MANCRHGLVLSSPTRRAYRMGMPAATDTRSWTPNDVWALPDDGNRYECIDGVLLVTPAAVSEHQRFIEQLFLNLAPQVRTRALGELRCLAADIRLHPGNLVQPDLFVAAPAADGRLVRDWSEITSLRLAVEVLSPSTARYDRGLKRRYYQRALVEEYWIVDLEARLVERWRPDDERPEILSQTLTWQPSGADEPLAIDLEALFRGVLGE